jgi:hypothetical protein
MKQFIILAALVIFLTSCGGFMTETTPATDPVTVDTTKVDTTACCKDSVKKNYDLYDQTRIVVK